MSDQDGIRSFGTDWNAAEKFAEQWARDTRQRVAVVEDYSYDHGDFGTLLVMTGEFADAYVEDRDAEIKYDVDQTPGREEQ